MPSIMDLMTTTNEDEVDFTPEVIHKWCDIGETIRRIGTGVMDVDTHRYYYPHSLGALLRAKNMNIEFIHATIISNRVSDTGLERHRRLGLPLLAPPYGLLEGLQEELMVEQGLSEIL